MTMMEAARLVLKTTGSGGSSIFVKMRIIKIKERVDGGLIRGR